MNYKISEWFLEFKTPFSIAHGTRTGTTIVLLELDHAGIMAYGEASLPPYLPENTSSVRAFIQSFFESQNNYFNNLEKAIDSLHRVSEGNYAAKACIDIALHNWYAAKLGVPLYQMLGLKNQPLPSCTFTIGMDDEEGLKRKLEDAAKFEILKVKLGGENDKKIIHHLRQHTDKPFCVDVNQGWRDRHHALSMIEWLTDYKVLFVEQPLEKNDHAGQKWLFERSPLPVYADESVQVPADIDEVHSIFHGVNVKLMKCGGISEGIKMIRKARHYNMKVLLGSMAETGCAITAAAQISSLADLTDLDGPLLTKNNPFDIVKYEYGRVVIE